MCWILIARISISSASWDPERGRHLGCSVWGGMSDISASEYWISLCGTLQTQAINFNLTICPIISFVNMSLSSTCKIFLIDDFEESVRQVLKYS